ncbi:MAG TPA: hypothetical protein VHO24_19725 [Opitutaceae bacterium]|nr:hypothetical protein [Opitutaceae bacterium]
MQTPWKVIAAFIGVFIAGSVFGGFFALRMDRGRGPQKRVEQGQQAGPLQLRIMKMFAERLELTQEQKDKLRPVIERAGEDIRRVQQAQSREMNILMERLQQDVAQVLTPEQKQKLDEMKQQQRERMKGDRGGLPDRRGELPGGTMREKQRERNRDGTPGAPPPAVP